MALLFLIGATIVGLGGVYAIAIPAVSSGLGADVPDKPLPSPVPPSRRGAAPIAPDHRPDLAGASDVDRPADFSYASKRAQCAQEAKISEPLKEVALGIDEAIRTGSQVSPAEEKALGDEAIAEFSEHMGGRLNHSGPMADYLSRVAAPIVAQVARKEIRYRFYVWEGTDIENAMALPGGHVIFSEPFIKSTLTNEAQLAAVLGHEIAHVDLRHPIAVLETARALGVPEDDLVPQMLIMLARLPYSAAQESHADRYGGQAIHQAGYSVFQAAELWRQQESRQPQSGKTDELFGMLVSEVENLLQTHPDHSYRRCKLEQLSYDLYQKDAVEKAYVGARNFRERRSLSEQTY